MPAKSKSITDDGQNRLKKLIKTKIKAQDKTGSSVITQLSTASSEPLKFNQTNIRSLMSNLKRRAEIATNFKNLPDFRDFTAEEIYAELNDREAQNTRESILPEESVPEESVSEESASEESASEESASKKSVPVKLSESGSTQPNWVKGIRNAHLHKNESPGRGPIYLNTSSAHLGEGDSAKINARINEIQDLVKKQVDSIPEDRHAPDLGQKPYAEIRVANTRHTDSKLNQAVSKLTKKTEQDLNDNQREAMSANPDQVFLEFTSLDSDGKGVDFFGQDHILTNMLEQSARPATSTHVSAIHEQRLALILSNKGDSRLDIKHTSGRITPVITMMYLQTKGYIPNMGCKSGKDRARMTQCMLNAAWGIMFDEKTKSQFDFVEKLNSPEYSYRFLTEYLDPMTRKLASENCPGTYGIKNAKIPRTIMQNLPKKMRKAIKAQIGLDNIFAQFNYAKKAIEIDTEEMTQKVLKKQQQVSVLMKAALKVNQVPNEVKDPAYYKQFKQMAQFTISNDKAIGSRIGAVIKAIGSGLKSLLSFKTTSGKKPAAPSHTEQQHPIGSETDSSENTASLRVRPPMPTRAPPPISSRSPKTATEIAKRSLKVTSSNSLSSKAGNASQNNTLDSSSSI
jgi:hypothetical protein